MTTELINALRRLAAHLDPTDPRRVPGRRTGTISPYADDFEIDAVSLGIDVSFVLEHLAKATMGES